MGLLTFLGKEPCVEDALDHLACLCLLLDMPSSRECCKFHFQVPLLSTGGYAVGISKG